MKLLKITVASLLIALSIISFSFTSKEKSSIQNQGDVSFTLPRYFEYTGPQPASANDLKTPSNWLEVTSLSPNHADIKVAGLKVINNESTYIDDNGTPTNFSDDILLVNVTSTFQDDVLKTGGFAPSPDNFIQEVFQTDYEVYTKS